MHTHIHIWLYRGGEGPHCGTTYKDGINAPDVTEEDGDVNKHEDIANGHRQDVTNELNRKSDTDILTVAILHSIPTSESQE